MSSDHLLTKSFLRLSIGLPLEIRTVSKKVMQIVWDRSAVFKQIASAEILGSFAPFKTYCPLPPSKVSLRRFPEAGFSARVPSCRLRLRILSFVFLVTNLNSLN